MTYLAQICCPSCGVPLIAPTDSRRLTVSQFEDCLRRCAKCGVGFSNAFRNPVRIYANPTANVPSQVHAGLAETLHSALNLRNRENKKRKFGFLTSEDAVTWTVFRFLQMTGQIGKVVGALGLLPSATPLPEPTMLLWGAPVPAGYPGGEECRKALVCISDRLHEKAASRSEPDVVLNFGEAGVVFIEAKYLSGNERIASHSPKFTHYLNGGTGFTDCEAIRSSGCYELARNWRIGTELAGSRPFTLVNLALPRLFRAGPAETLKLFEMGISKSSSRQFKRVIWREMLLKMNYPQEGWFDEFVHQRGLVEDLKTPPVQL